jgi:hypothetical protein
MKEIQNLDQYLLITASRRTDTLLHLRNAAILTMPMVNAIFVVMKSIKITDAPHQKWRIT